MRQILVKLVPRPTTAPSEKVTSETNDAASHRITGRGDGTVVAVFNGARVAVFIESVPVGMGSEVDVSADCVESAFNVAAADVYKALMVSAG